MTSIDPSGISAYRLIRRGDRRLKMRATRGIADYQINFCTDELSCLRQEGLFVNQPHVRAFFNSTPGKLCSGFVQNIIWTFYNLKKFVSAKMSVRETSSSIYRPPGNRHIYIDVTSMWAGQSIGGIARVTKKIEELSLETGCAMPVYIHGNILRTADGTGRRVELNAHDIYIVLGAFWNVFENYQVILKKAAGLDVRTVVCVYDIIPALYPAMMADGFSKVFTSRLNWMIQAVDLVITISKAAADEIRDYAAARDLRLKAREVKYFTLGYDAVLNTKQSVRPAFKKTFESRRTFVSVGTLMPHKGQYIALAAFDHLWRAGREDLTFVLIGKADEAFKAIENAIKDSPFLDRHLFWFDDVNDAELDYAYSRGMCLIQASIAEGYGVPVVEALTKGMPVIASDIPIFREIGGGVCTFFAPGDSKDLSLKIVETCGKPRSHLPFAASTWSRTLENLVDVVTDPVDIAPAVCGVCDRAGMEEDRLRPRDAHLSRVQGGDSLGEP